MARSGPGDGSADPVTLVEPLVDELGARADPARAADMAAYMRGQFEFFGVPTPERRRCSRALVAAARRADPGRAVAAVDLLWARPQRELRYVGADIARAAARNWGPERLADLRRWITTDSWWDTVDALSSAVGDLVVAHRSLVAELDRWIDDDDLWVARVALLHQLGRKEAADADRLYRYCGRRAADEEFFIRKAIGWALRDHARTDPDGVRAFVAAHPELSGLSRREALKHLG